MIAKNNQASPHKWIPSTLGHGEHQCIYCKATNREIAVIGDINHCDRAPKSSTHPTDAARIGGACAVCGRRPGPDWSKCTKDNRCPSLAKNSTDAASPLSDMQKALLDAYENGARLRRELDEWKARAEAAEANQRTPGMGEICEKCGDCKEEEWAVCDYPTCPFALGS